MNSSRMIDCADSHTQRTGLMHARALKTNPVKMVGDGASYVTKSKILLKSTKWQRNTRDQRNTKQKKILRISLGAAILFVLQQKWPVRHFTWMCLSFFILISRFNGGLPKLSICRIEFLELVRWDRLASSVLFSSVSDRFYVLNQVIDGFVFSFGQSSTCV